MATLPTPPVILIHGAWHGSWCWDQITQYLQSAGLEVASLTLPGHDDPGNRRRNWSRMSTYIDAVGEVAATFDRPAILVGHSMGGYVVQRYLENNTATAGVLVASMPLGSAVIPNLRLLRNHPAATIKSLLLADYSHFVRSTNTVASLFFRPETPTKVIDSTYEQLQNESALAIATMIVRPTRPKKVSTSVHVIAASDDAIFTLDEERDLAAAYNTQLRVIDNSGHDIMLDSEWQQLAELLVQIADPEAEAP